MSSNAASVAFEDIITRSYLVDPERTDQDLRRMGKSGLAIQFKIDHASGRLAENYGILSGKRVLTEPVESGAPMLGGARVTSAAAEDARE